MAIWNMEGYYTAEAITCERSLSLQALLFLHFSHRVFGRFNDTEAPYDAEEDVIALTLCPD